MKYESAAETAKKIRKTLKANFPGIKFSVRSENYAGGCAVNVSYTDGPAVDKVKSLCHQYQSASFDGSIDLQTNHGYEDPETGDHYDGADWVGVQRELSFETTKALADEILKRYGMNDPEAVTIKEVPPVYSRRMRRMTKGHRYIDIKYIMPDKRELYPLATMIHQEAHGKDL